MFEPRLTLNLGIRFDVLPHVYEKDNRTSNFVPTDFTPRTHSCRIPQRALLIPQVPASASQPARQFRSI